MKVRLFQGLSVSPYDLDIVIEALSKAARYGVWCLCAGITLAGSST